MINAVYDRFEDYLNVSETREGRSVLHRFFVKDGKFLHDPYADVWDAPVIAKGFSAYLLGKWENAISRRQYKEEVIFDEYYSECVEFARTIFEDKIVDTRYHVRIADPERYTFNLLRFTTQHMEEERLNLRFSEGAFGARDEIFMDRNKGICESYLIWLENRYRQSSECILPEAQDSKQDIDEQENNGDVKVDGPNLEDVSEIKVGPCLLGLLKDPRLEIKIKLLIPITKPQDAAYLLFALAEKGLLKEPLSHYGSVRLFNALSNTFQGLPIGSRQNLGAHLNKGSDPQKLVDYLDSLNDLH